MSTPTTRTPPSHTTWRWDLWSTYAFLGVAGRDDAGTARQIAAQLLAGIDRTCSRFRDDSDLSEVNRHPGTWVRVDPMLVAAVRVAVAAAEHSDGLVDPCLGREMVTLGYDTDLAVLRERPAPHDVPGHVLRPAPAPEAWREVEWTDDAVRIPRGVALDLGATAKAWAADVVAETVAQVLGRTVVVSLGGDLRVTGPDEHATWPVLVGEHPDQVLGESTDGSQLVEVRGGVATSSSVVRRWAGADGDLHHLLDPRTGLPANGPYRTVSAAGDTAAAANTASTAALVLGERAPAWLADHGVAARLVAQDGTVSTVGAWPTDDTDDTDRTDRTDRTDEGSRA